MHSCPKFWMNQVSINVPCVLGCAGTRMALFFFFFLKACPRELGIPCCLSFYLKHFSRFWQVMYNIDWLLYMLTALLPRRYQSTCLVPQDGVYLFSKEDRNHQRTPGTLYPNLSGYRLLCLALDNLWKLISSGKPMLPPPKKQKMYSMNPSQLLPVVSFAPPS